MTAFKLVTACAAISTTILATPAHAGWRFTEWGMTREQVFAASEGKIGPRDPKVIAREQAAVDEGLPKGMPRMKNGCTHRLLEPPTIAGITFDDVTFCFGRGEGLTAVNLHSPQNVQVVASALAESLGPAVEVHADSMLPTWRFVDREQGNTVTLMSDSLRDETGVGCTVRYTETASGF